MKKNLHFVYSFPNLKGHLHRIEYLAKRVNLSLKERCYLSLNWPQPIQAPFSISYNICNSLSKFYNLRLYDIHDTRDLQLGENDIFLGHAWPDFKHLKAGNNAWTTYDPNQIVNKVILKYPNDPRVKIIGPFNHSMEQTAWLGPLFEKMSTFIGIAGDYWFENLSHYPLSSKIGNFQHLNMAIDQRDYPLLKKEFNNKGKRKFLYIGRLSKEKNLQLLEDLAKNNNFEGGYISDGDGLKGWKKLSDFRKLTPEYMKTIIKDYDVFVSASNFDAQATTVLEAMCWGLMILCTKESGYCHESMFLLDLENETFNNQQIYNIQERDNNEFIKYQLQNLTLIKTKYSWNRFNLKLNKILTI